MCSHIAAFRIATNMRIDLAEHIAKLPLGFVDSFGSGRLRKIVNDSTGAAETYLAHRLPDKYAAIATPLGLLAMLLVFDWRLGLLSLVPVFIAFSIMSAMTGKRMAEKMKQYNNALENMSNEAVEYVRGIPVVKTFGQSVFSFKKFKGTIDEYAKWVIAYTKDMRMIVSDALSRVDGVLSAAFMPESEKKEYPKDSSVTLSDVHFSYDGKKEVIRGVSMNIGAGQTVAFVGPSGGGKSTLASLIARFFDVKGGSIKIDGSDIRNIPKEKLMESVSFVFQDSKLIKATVSENVKMGKPDASDLEVAEALKIARCDDIIEKLPNGINTVIGTKGVYLSGGEQQRLTIARAVLKNAPVLILDEATAFADPDNEVKVQAAFSELSKGKTVIMIAHRLSTVQNADCIYVIADGKIVESGTHNELMKKNGLYAKMQNDYQSSVKWKVSNETALEG